MKTLLADERQHTIGPYISPAGLYEYIKSLPFLGTVKSDITSLEAGQWTEIKIVYTVGGSGLADGAWIKGTFKFYSVDTSTSRTWSFAMLIIGSRTGHFSKHQIPLQRTISQLSMLLALSYQDRHPQQSKTS